MFKTYSAKPVSKMNRKWYLVDANEQVLGRLATIIAVILRGKNKPTFSPHIDHGDYVIIINADRIRLTGAKEEKKEYIYHTGFPGGLRRQPVGKVRQENPAKIIYHAVAGMIPHNRLKKEILAKLKIYAGEKHEHESQKPEKIEL